MATSEEIKTIGGLIGSGFWVLACLFDTQDHREHTRLGMECVIHITR